MGSPFVLKLKYKCNQPSGGVLKKSCSENMLQIYRRTPMPKCDFNKVVSKHLFKNISGRLLLKVLISNENPTQDVNSSKSFL